EGENQPVVSQDVVVAVVPIRPGDSSVTLRIAGRSVLDGTIRALRAVEQIGPIVLAVQGIRNTDCLAVIENPRGLGISVTASWGSRWEAIRSALAMAGSGSTVLLHNPDRPLVSASGIVQLLAALRDVPAVVTAMPVHGSIKRVVDGRILATVPRDLLHVVQSPWVFQREPLERALRAAIAERWPASQELELVRLAGIPVRVAEGHRFNVPISSPADARFAEMAVRRRLVSVPGLVTTPV
ncbi:MAG TPA: 2-C-methyl-D-erythritol 4-phosphate cytidylyltransferase, partial [Candidatus Saccharimonadales bacterium]|nr:2-C-methyl-D-erythritol 4-phosphate cytidylyltransferase [Candidatus Saccharimonadales bacterium]